MRTTAVNPMGVEVHSFKRPSEDELDHDFLWRTTLKLPARGHIGVFNRSYYEEVLICKVHPEIITKYQRLPVEMTKDMKKVFAHRYESIRDFEEHIARNGTRVVKFFLNVSKKEQAARFLVWSGARRSWRGSRHLSSQQPSREKRSAEP